MLGRVSGSGRCLRRKDVKGIRSLEDDIASNIATNATISITHWTHRATILAQVYQERG